MFSDKNNDGYITQNSSQEASEVTQENHYYPFGLSMEGTWQNTPSVTDSKYLYNGKELNDDFGLGLMDYGARMYDAAIGRWNSIDKMSNIYKNETSYCYVGNNPILNFDIKGEFKIPASIRAQYPHFAAYLDNNIKEILNSPKIMKNLLKYSGGKLTREAVEKDIVNNSGPEIITGNKDSNDGNGGVLYVDGQFDGEGRNEIFISNVLLGEFEKVMKNPKVGKQIKQAILLNVVATLLHEYVHYGDRDEDYAEDADGNQRKSQYENDFEEGHAFSMSVYGFTTGRIPGFPGAGFDLQNALLFINKKKVQEGTNIMSISGDSKENEKEIPTPPVAAKN